MHMDTHINKLGNKQPICNFKRKFVLSLKKKKEEKQETYQF